MADQGTRLETEDEVRRALQMHRPAANGRLPAASGRLPAANAAAADDCPPLFRPTLRPPTPILTVCDDGSESGELIRIRKDSFVIGRTEGDLIIPHDTQISGRHAELRRSFVKEKHRWSLIDLHSTNGTYVRVGQAILEHGQEFLIGRTRFRFENEPAANSAPPKPASASQQSTRFWQPPSSDGHCAAIIEVTDAGKGPRFLLDSPEIWLGKDAACCQIVLSKDAVVMHGTREFAGKTMADGCWKTTNRSTACG